jgi:haloalkane dehalogenase
VTLVVQDWGGLLGLTLPVTHPGLISRLLLMNTGFAVGTTPGAGFLAWRDYVANTPDFAVGDLLRRSEPDLTDAEVAAYDAPFPDATYKAGVRRFPQLVPIDEHGDGAAISRRAVQWWSTSWDGPTFMAVGQNDPVLGPKVMERMRSMIRGCPPPMMVAAGHFVQEHGDQVAAAALASWAE